MLLLCLCPATLDVATAILVKLASVFLGSEFSLLHRVGDILTEGRLNL